MTIPPVSLTKYPSGSFREIATLSSSLILVLFSATFMSLCDRLMLAHYSTQALEACVSAFYLSQLFQFVCTRITSIAQVFVGQYKGSGELNLIGPCVWQMVWFSLL